MTKTNIKYFNPNPKKNEKIGDCVVRAMCKATGKDWDTVYKELCELGFELKAMPNDNITWQEYLKRNGFERKKISIKKGQKRPTVDQFARENRKGIYVLRVTHHLVTSHEGYYYDTWDCGRKAVYSYWEKTA